MSKDYGASWGPPEQIASHCWYAVDMATTPSGQIAVLANCWTMRGSVAAPHATLLIRDGDGRWQAPQSIDVEAWSGAVAVAGDRQDLRITALAMPFAQAPSPSIGHLIGKYLADPGPWQVQSISLVPQGSVNPGSMRWQARHLSFTRLLPAHQVGLVFVFFQQTAGGVTNIVRRLLGVLQVSWSTSFVLGMVFAYLLAAAQLRNAAAYTGFTISALMLTTYFLIVAVDTLKDCIRTFNETVALGTGLSATRPFELTGQAAVLAAGAATGGVALGLTADQNPRTFLGSEQGRFIFENAAAKVLFHLDDLPARQMGDAISDLTPAHIEFLSHMQPREGIWCHQMTLRVSVWCSSCMPLGCTATQALPMSSMPVATIAYAHASVDDEASQTALTAPFSK